MSRTLYLLDWVVQMYLGGSTRGSETWVLGVGHVDQVDTDRDVHPKYQTFVELGPYPLSSDPVPSSLGTGVTGLPSQGPVLRSVVGGPGQTSLPRVGASTSLGPTWSG